jgi:hypothetical protein
VVAVMRLLTPKPLSDTSLKKTMMFAWALAQKVTFCDIDENRFLVHANYLEDWKRITEQGLWIFRDHGLHPEKYDGSCNIVTLMYRIHVWVQVHDVPELYVFLLKMHPTNTPVSDSVASLDALTNNISSY